MAETVTVPVINPAQSKINWTALASGIASIAAYFGLQGIDPNTLASILVGINAATSVAMIIYRTFFTKSVVSTSVAPLQ